MTTANHPTLFALGLLYADGAAAAAEGFPIWRNPYSGEDGVPPWNWARALAWANGHAGLPLMSGISADMINTNEGNQPL